MPKCVACKKSVIKESSIVINLRRFCDYDCATEFAVSKANRDKLKAQKKKDRHRLEELMTFPAKMAKLQKLTNQYYREVLYANDDCYTCGAKRGAVKFDWGHFIPVGAGGGDRRRFMPENGRPQCVRCNQHGSGMRSEFKDRMTKELGKGHVEWLENESNHPTLKELFPTHQDWLDEVAAIRDRIRKAGLRPCI